MSALNRQVGGAHYVGLAIQPVEFWMGNLLGGCEGSVVKYVTRWRDKGGIEDLRKARHFLDFMIQNTDYQRRFGEQRQAYPIRYPDNVLANDYALANRLPAEEAFVVRMVFAWNVTAAVAKLQAAASQLDLMIEGEI